MTVVPDSIEPLVLYRAWRYSKHGLRSMHGNLEWKPGEPVQATCLHPTAWHWEIAPRHTYTYGMTLEQAVAHAAHENEYIQKMSTGYGLYRSYELIPEPTVEPPPGCGYLLVADHHAAPDENCSCGIYAADEETALAYAGSDTVLGTVSLWGKIVPGENGARGEYAYPASFIVPAKLANDKTLRAFGVPIQVQDESAPSLLEPLRRERRRLHYAVLVNVAFACLNLAFVLVRLLG